IMHLCITQCTYWTPLILYFAALCLSDISPLARPISISNDSIVLFAVQETLSILLQVHISQTSIFFQDYSLLKPRTIKLISPLASLGTPMPTNHVESLDIYIARSGKWIENLKTNLCLYGDFIPRPVDVDFSILTPRFSMRIAHL